MSTEVKRPTRAYIAITIGALLLIGVTIMVMLTNGSADDPVPAPVNDGATLVPGTLVPDVEPSGEPLNNTQGTISASGGTADAAPPQLASGVEMRDPEPAPSIDPGSGPTAGCVLGYGDNGQCLTVVPPSHTHHPDHGPAVDMATLWTCSEVTLYFKDGIVVNDAAADRDRLGLDSNNDGVACGPGDTGN